MTYLIDMCYCRTIKTNINQDCIITAKGATKICCTGALQLLNPGLFSVLGNTKWNLGYTEYFIIQQLHQSHLSDYQVL